MEVFIVERMNKDFCRKLKVLVIDDVRAPRHALRRLLAYIAIMNVVEAESGSEALKKLEKEEFNVIICDLNLGDMKGTDILHHVRSRSKTAETPFIMMTSDIDREDLIEAKRAGVSGYMLKPFNVDKIQTCLSSVFEVPLVDELG